MAFSSEVLSEQENKISFAVRISAYISAECASWISSTMHLGYLIKKNLLRWIYFLQQYKEKASLVFCLLD